MNRLLVFLLFIFLIDESHSQPSTKEKIARADSLLELSYQSYTRMDIHSSLRYAMEALTLSEENNYSKGKSRGNFYIGQVLWSLGEYGETIEYLQLAEEEPYTARDLILSSEICRVKGRTYGSLQLNDLAAREFQKGLHYINRIKTTFEREYLTSLAYDNLSHLYFSQNLTDSTLYYLNLNEQLLNNTTEEQLFRNRINLYAQLGKAYTIQEEYSLATRYFTEALELAKANDYPYTSWINLQWGNMKRKQGLLDSAVVYYHLGLENLRQTNLRNELPGLYGALRDVYMQQGNSDSALVYQQQMTIIESELGEANLKALDMAIQILLKEEKKYQTFQVNRARSIAFVLTGAIALLAIGLRIRWKKRYQSVAKKKQQLQKTMEEQRNGALDEVVELARQNDSSFLPRFMELFPRFTQHIYQRHPDLSQSSFQFCAYVFLHFSSKEIAEYLFIEHKSVQTRKNRLRKQLDLPPNTDLYQYMRWLDEPEESADSIPE